MSTKNLSYSNKDTKNADKIAFKKRMKKLISKDNMFRFMCAFMAILMILPLFMTVT